MNCDDQSCLHNIAYARLTEQRKSIIPSLMKSCLLMKRSRMISEHCRLTLSAASRKTKYIFNFSGPSLIFSVLRTLSHPLFHSYFLHHVINHGICHLYFVVQYIHWLKGSCRYREYTSDCRDIVWYTTRKRCATSI